MFALTVKAFFAISLLILGNNLFQIISGSGWVDRFSFFIDGIFAPTLPDFIFNEIVLVFFLLYVVIVKARPIIIIIFIAAAFAYYNRSPIILLCCALIFSPNIAIKRKAILGAALLAITGVVMFLRVGGELFDYDVFSLFFFTYPFVGVARLIEASASADVNVFHIISVLVKPIDAVFFVIDYFYELKGSLSATRFVGSDLTLFVYLPLLGDSFNAFGTVAYPFILIFGWIFGPVLFVAFIFATYHAYRFHFRQHAVAFRIILMILISGFLFSWASPFIWILPFVFPRSLLEQRSEVSSAKAL